MSEDVTHGRAPLPDLTGLADQITNYLRTTLADLSDVRAELQRLLNTVAAEERRPQRADLNAIRDSLQACLRRPGHPMDRIGVAAAMDYLADAPYWMEWWSADPRGELEYVSHSLNPQQDAFYDYTTRTWFASVESSGKTAIIGPYVDFGGINGVSSYSYTVTISMPILTPGGFAGVAGADILAGQFERFLLTVDPKRAPIVLANSDLRVIASNTSAYLPGDLIPASDASPATAQEVGPDVFPLGKSWRLLTRFG